MKHQKKFITTIIGTLAICLVTTTTFAKNNDANVTDAKIQINIISDNDNNINSENEKEKNNQQKLEKQVVQDEVKTSNSTVEKKEVTQKTEVTQTEDENVTLPTPTGNFLYAKALKTPVYDNIEKGKVVLTLKKATRVVPLEERVVEIKKETKTKKPDGKIAINTTIIKEKWTKVSYFYNRTKKTGWIKSENLEKNVYAVLPDNLKKIDFTPVEKKNFTNNPKKDVRGVYLTIYSCSLPNKVDEIISLIKRTPINAIVIDVKEDGGNLLFKTEAEKKYLGSNQTKYPVNDIKAFMKKLKDNNIYTIARIVSFKDPRYAKKNPEKTIIKRSTGQPFTNSDGVIWVSAHDRNLWEYNIAVAKEAAAVGFNEIQFDYVRFPASNGGKLDKELDYRNTKNESKPETIQKYLKYARKQLEPYNVYISADIYGQVGSSADDMGLGQYWEVISNEVDFVSSMAYPSHYGKGVYGLPVPDAQPYKTIYYSTLNDINRNANVTNPAALRPWLQAFTAKWVKGYIPYGKKEIDEQTKALADLGINSYLLWSPTNKYGMIEK